MMNNEISEKKKQFLSQYKNEPYEIRQFMSLYRTYEGLLRDHGTDYRTMEETQPGGRMTMMRQMRNYLSHEEDHGFIAVSSECLTYLEKLVKEEYLKDGIVKDHLITPAKGSLKEGMLISKAVLRLSSLALLGTFELPVYDSETKLLKGTAVLDRLAFVLDKEGNVPLNEKVYGRYGNGFVLVKPDDKVPDNPDGRYYCCTKDGTMDSPYMGYLDK